MVIPGPFDNVNEGTTILPPPLLKLTVLLTFVKTCGGTLTVKALPSVGVTTAFPCPSIVMELLPEPVSVTVETVDPCVKDKILLVFK